jgi:hypothetical protein
VYRFYVDVGTDEAGGNPQYEQQHRYTKKGWEQCSPLSVQSGNFHELK